MSEQTHQIDDPLTRDQRKQLLALACAADRVAWVQACRPLPPRSPLAQMASQALKYLEPFSHLLPGRLGRWARSALMVANLTRQFDWLTR